MSKNSNGAGNGSRNEHKNGKPPTNTQGKRICGARVRNCRKCRHHFPAAEYRFVECPDCGETRLCQETKLYPNGRCHLHGGPSRGRVNGASTTNYKHGLYRRVWKKFSAEDMFAVLMERRDELLDPMDSLGSMQTRIIQLAEGAAGSIVYQKIQEAWTELRAAGHNKIKQDIALEKLNKLIEEGATEADKWKEIWELEEQANKLRYQLHKMEVERGMLVRLEYALAIIGAHYNAAKAIVTARLTEVGDPGLSRLIIRQLAEALDSIVGGSGADALRLGLGPRNGTNADKADDPGV